MSQEIPKLPGQEGVDDSWVKLVEGEPDEPAMAEAPIEKTESPAPVEAPIETPAVHEAAISEVRRNLAHHAEAPAQKPEIPAAAVPVQKAERPVASPEKIREQQGRAFFDRIAFMGGSKRWNWTKEEYAAEMLKRNNGNVQGALESVLRDEVSADHERRKKVAGIVTVGSAMGGLGAATVSAYAGATDAIASLGGATIPGMSIEFGVAGIAVGGLTYVGMSLWDGIKRNRHRGTFQKIYGRAPKGSYLYR